MATEVAANSVAAQLSAAAKRLDLISDNARLDAELLLAETLGWARTQLYTRAENQLTETEIAQFESLLQQRIDGKPIAYLLGRQEFWSLNLSVSDAVLVPRADTELLVELTLQLAPKKALSVLELGTGSGAIVLALASEKPDWHITACDVSTAALAVAIKNAHTLALNNIRFTESDWFSALVRQQFDIIVSNPPYICIGDPHLDSVGVKFEPELALSSGADGLQAIRHIVANARRHLYQNGKLLLEHGFDQAQAVRELLRDSGYTDIVTQTDAGGCERVSYATYPGYS